MICTRRTDGCGLFLSLSLFTGALLGDSPRSRKIEGEAASKPLSNSPGSTKLGLDVGEEGGWSSGFRKAGHRVIISLGNGRTRLEYKLASRESEAGEDLGKIGFFENWLLGHLREQFPLLDAVEILDRGVARTDGVRISRVFERMISVRGQKSQVENAEAYLDRLRSKNRDEVELEIYVLTRPGSPSSHEVDVTALTASEFKNKLSIFSANEIKVMANAILRCRGAEEVVTATVNQMAYVKDWEVKTIRDAVIGNPVVDTLEEGFVLTVLPVLDAAKPEIHLHVNLRLNTLKRPVPELVTTLGKGLGPVTVQLPEFSTIRMASEALTLKDDEAGLLLFGPGYVSWSEDGEAMPQTIILMIRARSVGAPNLQETLGTVLGFDPSNRRVFVKSLQEKARVEDMKSIVRNGKVVGTVKVVEVRSDLVILDLTGGEAKAGDEVR